MQQLLATLQALPWWVSGLLVVLLISVLVFALSKDRLLRRRNINDRRQLAGSAGVAKERRRGKDRRQA